MFLGDCVVILFCYVFVLYSCSVNVRKYCMIGRWYNVGSLYGELKMMYSLN